MVTVETRVVDVQLVENLVTRRAFFELQVACNVHKAKVTMDVRAGK